MTNEMKIATVIPHWNKRNLLDKCLKSLFNQSVKSTIIVVDNNSTDNSRELLESYEKKNKIIAIYNHKNKGFTGGVIPGMQYALDHNFDAVALFNNDAIADRDWLKNLASSLSGNQDLKSKNRIGMVTCSFRNIDKKHIDSTGDQFTVWGLPYPRGRDTLVSRQSSVLGEEFVFGASGGATLYSCEMLRVVGLLDDDFFAYFEDTDISFRAQLAGWKVMVNHKALAYHATSSTSSGMKGFSTYQSIKNWPLVIIKNVPKSLLPMILPRFMLAYTMFITRAFTRRQGLYALRGLFDSIKLWPKKLHERKIIQSSKSKKVTDEYIFSIMTHDLPENAHNLRKLRRIWWKLTRRKI
jgi:GT2 family glycosyltransferase